MHHLARVAPLALLLVIVLLTGCAAAQDQDDPPAAEPPAEHMPRVALQMYTLREHGSLERQLELAATVGYEAVELLGTHDHTAEEVADLLEVRGLEVTSMHVYLGALRHDLGGAIRDARVLRTDTLVLPVLTGGERPVNAAEWDALGRGLASIGARLHDEGIQLAYHNHDFEMEVLDGRPAIDHLLGAADPAHLAWQPDVAWIVRGGQDPVALLERHAGRLVSIHAKDNAPSGENEAEQGFADVGHGVLDWERILPAAWSGGARWFIVEHDAPVDEERTIRRSREFLRKWLEGVD